MKKDEKKENKLNNMVSAILDNLGTVLDANTVVGKPVLTPDGETVIPISKVTIGFVSGGGEYGDVKFLKYDGEFPFAGGNGAILSVKPSGFLISKENGAKFYDVTASSADKLFDSAAEFLSGMAKNYDKKD